MMQQHTRLLPAGLMIWAVVLLTTPTMAQIDFGDHASSTLTTKAWEAMGRGELDTALTYANQCISMYETEAFRMQASLSAFPANDPPETTFAYWALNDVGTCYFIKGEIFLKKSDTKAALEAFTKCAERFSYSQCWDTRGWFWRPGVSAKQKVLELSFDAE